MAALQLDNDVSLHIVPLLEQDGQVVVTARGLGLAAAADAAHIMVAARAGRVLITHNRKDFEVLQDAWRLWPVEWHVAPLPVHAGILVIPQRWSPQQAAAELAAIIQSGPTLANELYTHTVLRGWVRYP